MSYARSAAAAAVLCCLGAAGCTVRNGTPPMFDTGGPTPDGGPADTSPPPVDMGHDAPPRPDVGPIDAYLSPDAACESATTQATLTRLPADIIWVIDNSGSMAPAITQIQSGINGFATQLAASDLDYRLIVLSLRRSAYACTTASDCASHPGQTACVGGYCGPSGRYPVCFPTPVAGADCADNAPRFFQIPIDIKSTKPVEQILGTLAQSAGYTMGTADGGPPWRDLLRPGATRTFVLVSDDNARTCALPGSSMCAAGDPPITDLSLENFPGGGDPFNSSTLGPGILDPSYMGLFDGYTFDAIYGWGSETDPNVRCVAAGGGSSFPASSGPTYTTLVQRTGGVRAQICDPAADFPMFFDAIAASVVSGSPIECTVDIPPPPAGMVFQSGRVNVVIRGTSGDLHLPYVRDLASCDATRGGWYYDDIATPTQILLCPASCTTARAEVTGPTTGLDVQFGCQSILM